LTSGPAPAERGQFPYSHTLGLTGRPRDRDRRDGGRCRGWLAALLVLAVLVTPAAAQRTRPIARIGFLMPVDAPSIGDGFRQGLQELGYAETGMSQLAHELDAAFADLARERPDAVVVLVDPVFAPLSGRISQQAAQLRLPTVSGSADYAEAGGLMAYGPSYPDLARRAAYFVDKVLEGGKPADLPVEQPTKFELVINKKTAKTLGLTIPPSLLLRVDHVVD
jgi:hypothetical protein